MRLAHRHAHVWTGAAAQKPCCRRYTSCYIPDCLSAVLDQLEVGGGGETLAAPVGYESDGRVTCLIIIIFFYPGVVRRDAIVSPPLGKK